MIDWNSAPEGATFYAWGIFYTEIDGKAFYIHDGAKGESCYNLADLKRKEDYETRPQEWPTDEQRIDVIGSNGPSGEHYDAPRANKYDRTIIGKYGTGSCTVDVYRVLNAFGPLSPEIDHSVKKLLAAGTRGAKSERQDLLEAIQSIDARLQYLEVRDGDKQ